MQILALRLILGVVFAALIIRFFYPKAQVAGVVALGAFLVGMAYVLEYFRKRKGTEK